MTEVPQWLRAREIRRRREKVGAPQFALAHFADVSTAALSTIESGRKMMSEEMQQNIDYALRFFEYLAEQSPAPVDFGALDRIDVLLREYKKMRDPEEVVRTKSEQAAAAK